jgi:hypothetical protein
MTSIVRLEPIFCRQSALAALIDTASDKRPASGRAKQYAELACAVPQCTPQMVCVGMPYAHQFLRCQ